MEYALQNVVQPMGISTYTVQETFPKEWNKSLPTKEERFIGNEKINSFSKKDWEEITEDVFREIFKKSPVKRTKFDGLKRNIDFVKSL